MVRPDDTTVPWRQIEKPDDGIPASDIDVVTLGRTEPWTTMVDGKPELVWDDNGQIMMTEVFD